MTTGSRETHYLTGEEIHVGDRVLFGGHPAMVVAVIGRGEYASIDHARDIPSGVPARTNLARLHNAAGEALQALAVLAGTIEDLERVAPDSVQFVIVESCRALLTLGRVDDARLILRRALAAFPHRVELARLEDYFVGSR